MSAEAVVSASLKAFERRRVVCVPGVWNRVLVALGQAALACVLVRVLDRALP
jgi:hypothetical protein